MNRRGFLRLLAGGVAAFRALGVPTAKIEQSIFGSGHDGDLVLSGNMTMKTTVYHAYNKLDLNGWTIRSCPDRSFTMYPPGMDIDDERPETPEGKTR